MKVGAVLGLNDLEAIRKMLGTPHLHQRLTFNSIPASSKTRNKHTFFITWTFQCSKKMSTLRLKRGLLPLITAPSRPLPVTESVVLPPDLAGVAMTDIRTSTLTLRAIARPRCPQCNARTLLQRSTAGRPGFEHWTLRCTKCGHIHEAQVAADPMTSDANGWLSGELRSPT